jgi:hypothetical protein
MMTIISCNIGTKQRGKLFLQWGDITYKLFYPDYIATFAGFHFHHFQIPGEQDYLLIKTHDHTPG